MQKEYLGKTKNEIDVYVDMNASHASTHFAHHPKLLDAVKKIIPTIEAVGDIVRVQKDAGEVIGTIDLIETDENDEIVYAMRPLRKQYTRFVKNKQSQPWSSVVLDLRRVNEKEYSLYTAFVGRLTPSFPGGDYLAEQSKEFWSKHALVYQSEDFVPGTETTECPW